MSKPKGYWAWRIANPNLPAPTEFRAMPDGGTKVVWEGVAHGWWEVEFGYFVWDAEGRPVGGEFGENFHDPDYFSRDVSLETERDLARALAQYV